MVVDLPTPGAPVMPTRIALPVWGSRSCTSRCADLRWSARLLSISVMARASVARSPARMRRARAAMSVEAMGSGRQERDVQLGCRRAHRAVQRGECNLMSSRQLHVCRVISCQVVCSRKRCEGPDFIEINRWVDLDSDQIDSIHNRTEISNRQPARLEVSAQDVADFDRPVARHESYVHREARCPVQYLVRQTVRPTATQPSPKHRERSMPALFDPGFDLFMRCVDLESQPDLTQFLQCLPTFLDLFRTKPVVRLFRAHQLRHRLAVAGDDDFMPPFSTSSTRLERWVLASKMPTCFMAKTLTSLTRPELYS